MSENKEKVQAKLYSQYNEALNCLESGQAAKGQEQLEQILKDPNITQGDLKELLYGVYQSLAQVESRVMNPESNSKALYLYFKSSELSEDWETTRKMSILFRRIGMMPKALNLILKSLQQCTQSILHPPLIYQACCLAFLMNDLHQFQKFAQMIPESEYVYQQVQQISKFITLGQQSTFVKELLEERNQIPYKLENLPFHQFETKVFNQRFEITLKIDEYDCIGFLKEIRNYLRVFNDDENEDNDKLEEKTLIQDEQNITNTTIIIAQKLQTQNKFKQVHYQIDYGVKHHSKRQLEKIQRNQQGFSTLEEQLISERGKLIDIVNTQLGQEDKMIIEQANQNHQQQQQQKQIVNNNVLQCPISLYLCQTLETNYLTIVHLVKDLLNILLYQFNPTDEPTLQRFKQVQHKLLSCVIHYQYQTNYINEGILQQNPIIILKILEIAYNQLSGAKKCITPNRQRKIQNYIQLINNLKQDLMFNLNEHLKALEAREVDTFLQQFYTLMALIHVDPNFFQRKVAKHCAEKMTDVAMKCMIYEKLQHAKLQIGDNQNESLQINGFLESFEKMDQNLDFNGTTSEKLEAIMQYLKNEPNLSYIKRIIQLCLNQFYMTYQQEELKDINAKINLHIKPQEYLSLVGVDVQLGYLCFKYGLILSLIQDEHINMEFYLSCFINSLLNAENNIKVKSPKIILEIFNNLKTINYHKIMKFVEKDSFLRVFIVLKQEMKEYFEQRYSYLQNNINDDHELKCYLINLLDYSKPNQSQYILEDKVDQIEEELKFSTLEDKAEAFSCQSEDSYKVEPIFTKNYQEVNLTVAQAAEKFRLFDKFVRIDPKVIKVIQNKRIHLNLGSQQIQEEIKSYCKEELKQQFGTSSHIMKEQLIAFIEDYYVNGEQPLTETDLMFLELYLPGLHYKWNNSSTFYAFINVRIRTALQNYPFSLEQQQVCEQLNESLIVNPNEGFGTLTALMNSLKTQSNDNNFPYLQYLCALQDFKVIEEYCNQDLQIQENIMKYMIQAISLKSQLFYWQELYFISYNFAKIQFTQKQANTVSTTTPNWFLIQKKTYYFIEKLFKCTSFKEEQFIMDLLKFQQRKQEYKMNPSENNNVKVKQTIKSIYKTYCDQVIPLNPMDLQHNFRQMILFEKVVARNIKPMSAEQAILHLSKMRALVSLAQMIEAEDGFKELYKGKQYVQELESDFYISLYKIIKRMLKDHQYDECDKFVKAFHENFNNLLKGTGKQHKFRFQSDAIADNILIQQILSTAEEVIKAGSSKFAKKDKTPRFVVMCRYYYSKMLYNSGRFNEAYENINVLFVPNSLDLVNYYKIFNKYYMEKDAYLADYYNHELVFNQTKSKILKFIIDVFFQQQKWKELFTMMNKLTKNYESRFTQMCNGFLIHYDKITDTSMLIEIAYRIYTQSKSNDKQQKQLDNTKQQGQMLPLLVKCYILQNGIQNVTDMKQYEVPAIAMMEELKQQRKKKKKVSSKKQLEQEEVVEVAEVVEIQQTST